MLGKRDGVSLAGVRKKRCVTRERERERGASASRECECEARVWGREYELPEIFGRVFSKRVGYVCGESVVGQERVCVC